MIKLVEISSASDVVDQLKSQSIRILGLNGQIITDGSVEEPLEYTTTDLSSLGNDVYQYSKELITRFIAENKKLTHIEFVLDND